MHQLAFFDKVIINKAMVKKVLFMAFSLTVVVACAPLDSQLPETDIPDNWHGPIETQAAIWPKRNWWEQFES